MDRVTELIEELSESLGDQQQFQIDQKLEQEQAVSDFYNTPEGRQALGIAGALLTLGIPLPGARAAGASKMYGAVGTDMSRMLTPPLTKIGKKATTRRGPRGPINIDSSKQIPLPLRGGRNTGGLSDTDKAMLEFIKPRPRQEGIPSVPTGKGTKSYIEKISKTKPTEQQLNMRNTIQQQLYRMDSMIRQGEKVNMKEYFKLQKELEALNKILN